MFNMIMLQDTEGGIHIWYLHAQTNSSEIFSQLWPMGYFEII